MDTTSEVRAAALAQLKQAQRMIEEGRQELSAAHEKIRIAQELIDQSADTLRETSPAHHPTLHLAVPAEQAE
ncbi:MAG TPA: hypothetical protein VHC19_15845 [Pirellulales bacterium]|jgi:hypothetical protein|nr:hypothetical protein [Pirellulales bacterium]